MNDNSKISVYQIVGEYESDIENKKLSINSPLARGLIGKTKESFSSSITSVNKINYFL